MALPDLGSGSLHPLGPVRLADCPTRSSGGRPDLAALGQRAGDRVRCRRPGPLRLSRRRNSAPVVSALGDELGRVGFAIAAALIAVTLPVQVFLSVLQVLASLEPGGAAARLSFDITPLVTRVIDPSRVLVGVVVLILAVRAARRGQAGRALVLGGIGVMLVALARQLLFGDRTPAPINPDALNLVASAVVVVAVVILLLRRS